MMMFDMSVSETDTVDVDKLTVAVTKKKNERAEAGYTDAQLITSAMKALDPENTDFIPMDELRMKLMCTGEKLPEADVCSSCFFFLHDLYIYI